MNSLQLSKPYMYTQDEFCILLVNSGFLLLPPPITHMDRSDMGNYTPFLSLHLTQHLVLEIEVHEKGCLVELSHVGDKIFLPRISLAEKFDLYVYLANIYRYDTIFKGHEDMLIGLENWLSAYKNGYSFNDFVKAVQFDKECSFCFTTEHNLHSSDKFLHYNDTVRFHYECGIDRVEIYLSFVISGRYTRLSALYFTQMKSIEQFFDAYVTDQPKIRAYRRKQILDNIIPQL